MPVAAGAGGVVTTGLATVGAAVGAAGTPLHAVRSATPAVDMKNRRADRRLSLRPVASSIIFPPSRPGRLYMIGYTAHEFGEAAAECLAQPNSFNLLA